MSYEVRPRGWSEHGRECRGTPRACRKLAPPDAGRQGCDHEIGPVCAKHNRATQTPLRGDAPPNGKCPVIGVLDPQEVVMTAALVGVMAFRQEQERPLRGLGVFFRRVAA